MFSPSAILMDLDGTIADSAPGITLSLAHTFQALGMPIPRDEELIAYVGPPLLDSFRNLAGLSHEQARHALSLYREHYAATGVFMASAYPGMEELLKAIHLSAIPFALATSKLETTANRTLENLGLVPFFDVITGASADEVRSTKAEVVAESLKRLRAFGADLSTPIMIGDRSHDVQGAREHSVPTIFVRWGYGSAAEESGAIDVASTAEELRSLLGL
jgi:phosphoglycolate phosphatase